MTETCAPILSDIIETCDRPIRAQLEQRLGNLPRSEQLSSILELVQVGIDTDERVIEIVAEAWDFLQSRALWNVRFPSLEDMKRAIEFEDSVKHMLERHHIVESRIQAACKGIRERWGGFLPDLLVDIAPPRFTRHVVEMLYRLSKMCPLDRAKEMLNETIQSRLKTPKTSKHPWITQADVAKVTKQLDPSPSKRLRGTQDSIPESTQLVPKRPRLLSGDTVQETSDTHLDSDSPRVELIESVDLKQPRHDEARSATAMTTSIEPSDLQKTVTAQPPQPVDGMIVEQRSGWVAFSEPCNCPPKYVSINDQDKEADNLRFLGGAIKYGIERLCLRHLRSVAMSSTQLNIPSDRDELQHRLRVVYRNRANLAHLRGRYPDWFTVDTESCDDDIYLHRAIGQTEFNFDSKKVFCRLAGPDEYETWRQSGRLSLENVFDYLQHSALVEMVQAEFNMFRYHHRSLPNNARFSLLRNMYYSLFQQMLMMDPVCYALNCAVRPDKQWRLITYPDIASDENPSDAFAALYEDAKFQPNLLSSIIRVRRLEGDVEDEGQEQPICTLAMAPACSVIESGILNASDTDLEICLFGWYVAVPEDHGHLEYEDTLSWAQVAAAHRDLEAPTVSVCGERPTFGRPQCRFPGSVMLDSSSALGDALTGRRKWTDPQVIRERDILLGSDDKVAAQYVIEVRKKLIDNYQKAFRLMKEVEITAFGGSSFFSSVGSLN